MNLGFDNVELIKQISNNNNNNNNNNKNYNNDRI